MTKQVLIVLGGSVAVLYLLGRNASKGIPGLDPGVSLPGAGAPSATKLITTHVEMGWSVLRSKLGLSSEISRPIPAAGEA